jgi:hypothetical protein
VCDNAIVLPVDRVDAAVQSELLQVLRPRVVKALIDVVFEALHPVAVTKSVEVLQKDLKTLDRKIANLTAAVENGNALAPLVTQLTARHTERETLLLGEISAAKAVGQLTANRRDVEPKVLARIENWQAKLEGDVTERRQVLREILGTPFRFEADGKRYRFSADDTRGQLITGLVTGSTISGVPTGI